MIQVEMDLSRIKVADSAIAGINVAVQDAIITSMGLTMDKWKQTIASKLKSTASAYMNGMCNMYPYQNNPYQGAIFLEGKWPSMLEQGFQPFDMKKGFSNGKATHFTKNGGWYTTIPISHSTPNRNANGSPMSNSVYRQARRLPNWGHLNVTGNAESSWAGYQHKVNKYDGLTRIIQSNNPLKSGYVTFRRVSNKSDSKSWMHPGFIGVKAVDSLETFAQQTFQKAVNDSINQVFGRG